MKNLAKSLLFYFVFTPKVSECWQHSKTGPTLCGTPARIMHQTSYFLTSVHQKRCSLYVPNSRSQIRMSSSKDGNQEPHPGKSLVTAIDDFGQALKREAKKASQISIEASDNQRFKKVLYFILSSCYYVFFILYRAYRGVFILSPAIFRRVYVKLEEAISSDIPRTTDYESGDLSNGSWRTRLTVSTLAVIVTFSYFLGGALRSISKFFKTIRSTTSVSTSFEAMIEEISDHEDRVGGGA